jgi:hypothetical protein
MLTSGIERAHGNFSCFLKDIIPGDTQRAIPADYEARPLDQGTEAPVLALTRLHI